MLLLVVLNLGLLLEIGRLLSLLLLKMLLNAALNEDALQISHIDVYHALLLLQSRCILRRRSLRTSPLCLVLDIGVRSRSII